MRCPPRSLTLEASPAAPPVAGEKAHMNIQSVALRALWHRGLVAAVVVVAALVTMASARPTASPAAR